MAKHLSESRTEDTVMDLLSIRAWQTARPPTGQIIRKNEYRGFEPLAEIFVGRSKSGPGDAYPDFLGVESETLVPLIVIETKSHDEAIGQAFLEATSVYGDALREAGHPVIAIGVAGQDKTGIAVKVAKHYKGEWRPITYRGNEIDWIPQQSDVERLLASPALFDLEPVVPSPAILAAKADLINRILREAAIKDEFRPAYVGATMLAMWQSRGRLRRDNAFVLKDVNAACEDAFKQAGKPELAKSLRVDEANKKLAASTWEIIATLEKLNVATVSLAHDYLGQLYETFFRYTGGNTIGQYFTPRHITRFMADLCQTQPENVVIDPACGTGGFLIACMQRALDVARVDYETIITMVGDKLIGYESEPITAALCVANMILRGDGRTGIHAEDCFRSKTYPVATCQVALMNPPFPHKATDTPPEEFVERALQAVSPQGKVAVILPTSIMSKAPKGKWRSRILNEHSLLAVIQLPDEVFQPYASSNTCIVILEKGVRHSSARTSAFGRLHYDGLTLKKGTRVARVDGRNDLSAVLEAVVNKRAIPGVAGTAAVSGSAEWSPGAYIASAPPSEDELRSIIDELLRRLFSFYIRYANEVVQQRQAIAANECAVTPYAEIAGSRRMNNAGKLAAMPGVIGAEFSITYGMKQLHSRDGIAPGDSLIISPTERYNGCYGWLHFPQLIEPPFVTVASTGTIGEAFVQLEPCAVNDDCLILLEKDTQGGMARLFIAAAVIRAEKWRFTYGRKLTPNRIASFALPPPGALDEWVEEKIAAWLPVRDEALRQYE